MAAILEVLLSQEVTPDAVVSWLKNRTDLEKIPHQLKDYSKLDQEFVPFFLNYLRDQTLHLLQSNRSANPSPAKTPSAQKLKKSVQTSTRREDGGKRVQLFGSSPGDGLEDIRDTSSSVFSPNVSIDSPGVWKNSNTPSSAERSSRGRGHRTPGSRDQRQSPHCGSRQSNATPDSHGHRAKQRFSLGEFIVSPDVDINQNSKKSSPYSGGRKDHSFDNSPSPLPVNSGKRSSGKKRHSANRTDLTKPAPVFSLNSVSDFPPMGGETEDPIRKPEQKEESVFCTPYMKNSPNFEATPRRNAKPTVITKSRRISFTTLNEENADPTQMPSRRIKPTPIQSSKAWHHNRMFLDSAQNLAETRTLANDCGGTERRDSLTEERELLRQEKAKRLQQGELSRLSGLSSPGGPMTPTKYLERSNSVLEIAVADPSSVTYQDKLDVLAQLYSCCLKENLFPNLAVEIYFVVQLMTSRSADLELVSSTGGLDTIDTNFFCSVHNAVYFAVKVLESQVSFLRCLDRCTLRLLSENQRIASFSETLIDWLTLEHDLCPKPVAAFPKSPIGGVSFQAETDNRKNFPNDGSFHLFKKQRDTFYELLREWEAHHMSSGWSVAAFLGDKIRALINFKTELANHIHFARLFQSQLITMCKGDGSLKPDGDDEDDALLSQLKRTNPEKFKRLQERFIMPLSVGGPCPAPSFPGCQEFFRDFIMAAGSPIFNQHLTDTFSAKVMELNEISIASREETQTEQDGSDDEEKDRFVSCLMTVRLVAKFLGFVTFLPYQTGSRISDELSAMYISLRSHQSMQIDLVRCLKAAFFLGRLTVTVPWVVEFLSMMDQIAPNLEPIQIALFVLLYIHQQTWGRGHFTNTKYADLLVITTISWLFENAVIPEGFFFSEIPDEVVSIGPSLDHQTGVLLDKMGFVDQKLYYTCCPYMGEIRTLLVEFSVGTSSKNSTIRKITPISADDRTQPSMTERQTQLHLEENFFHNHPASLRRTVDFVADRTASNYIKRFRSTLLVSSIKESKTRLSDHMETQANSSPTAKAKDKLQSQLLKISQDCVQQVKATSATEVESYCEKKIDAALTLLLPDEQSRTVVTMATKICLRITMEKIQQWMTKHITTAMYQSELQTELERILKVCMLTQQKCNEAAEASHMGSNVTLETEGCTQVIAKEHDNQVPSPSDVLIEIKQVVRDVAFGHVMPGEVEIRSVISQVQTVMKKRQDVLPGVYVAYGQLVMDLFLALVQSCPDQWCIDKLEVFFTLWRTDLEKFTPLRGFLCPRVVLQMNNCSNPKLTWSVYSRVLMRLLEEHLLSCEQLSKMCRNTLQAIQDDVTHLGWCMCEVMDHIHDKGLCVSPLRDVLDWLIQQADVDSSLAKRITGTTKRVCPIQTQAHTSVKLVNQSLLTANTDTRGQHNLVEKDKTVYQPIVRVNQENILTCSKSDTSELNISIKRTEEITLANHNSCISNSVT